MRLAFDIETNGLIRQGMDRIHCIVAQDIDTGKVYKYTPENYRDGLKLLQNHYPTFMKVKTGL